MGAILRVKKDGEWIDIPALVGKDGLSPTVTVTDNGSQITITVEDKNGKKAISYEKGAGDMKKAVYDTDGDGVVDNAEKLGGELPSAYRKKADQIDYQTEVKNKPAYPKVTAFNVPTAQHNNGTTDLTPPYMFPLLVGNVGANDVVDVRVDYDSPLIVEDKATYREAIRNAMLSVDSMVDMGEGSYIIYLVCDGEFPTTITNMVFKIINYGAGVTA